MDRQRVGLWGTAIFAGLAIVGMAIQIYLIGGVAFGEGSGWLDAHKTFGKVTHGFYILTFLSALLAAWPNWRATGLAFALAVIGSVQAFLAFDGNFGGSDNPAIHAFHAALVPLVFLIAVIVGWRAYAALQARGPTPAT
jgi:hypothetical protein